MLFNDRTGISEVSCQTRLDEVTANYKAQVAGHGNEKVSRLLERSLTDASIEIASLFIQKPLLSFRNIIFYSFNRFRMKLTRPKLFKRSDHAAKYEWSPIITVESSSSSISKFFVRQSCLYLYLSRLTSTVVHDVAPRVMKNVLGLAFRRLVTRPHSLKRRKIIF